MTIDEHTGEAGFVTRLEAFVDMLMRKKRRQFVKNSDNITSADVVKLRESKILTGSAK